MEIYFCYHLATQDDLVVAFLSEFGFESFVEENEHTLAYIKDSTHKSCHAEILELLEKHRVRFTIEEIQPQNWNQIWEESFQPVQVGEFCMVRADFHPKNPTVAYDIIINPKMAFGTGHHATTFMMLEAMQAISFAGTSVLDYGAGTGILAILASMLGCKYVDAIDIEWESFQNILENASINKTDNIRALHGTLEDIDVSQRYQVILANINRNILIQSCEKLHLLLDSKGEILLSGILHEDVPAVRSTFENAGFIFVAEKHKNGWSCLQLLKNS